MSFTPVEAHIQYCRPCKSSATAGLLYCIGGHPSFLSFDKYMISYGGKVVNICFYLLNR